MGDAEKGSVITHTICSTLQDLMNNRLFVEKLKLSQVALHKLQTCDMTREHDLNVTFNSYH